MSIGAYKLDEDKPRISLLTPEFILGAARAMTYGATKYDAQNWRSGNGLHLMRLFDSLQRHLLAWQGGEDVDPESGLSHLDHAAANLNMIMWTSIHLPNNDDRYVKESNDTYTANTYFDLTKHLYKGSTAP